MIAESVFDGYLSLDEKEAKRFLVMIGKEAPEQKQTSTDAQAKAYLIKFFKR